MKKKTMLVIGVLIAIVAVVAFLRLNSGTDNSSQTAEPQAQVIVKAAHPTSVSDTLGFDAQGVVTAKGSLSVTSLSEGRIRTVNLSVGQPVKKGQAVAVLENRELDQELATQTAKLALIRQTVQDQEKGFQTAQQMLSLGIISQNDFVSQEQELNTRRSEAHDQETTVAQLQGREKNYQVVSNAEGFISSILPENSYVSYGQTVAEIISLGNEQVETYVPFDQLYQPKPGDEALISCNSFSVSGKVVQIYPRTDSNLITVIVVPDNPIPMNLKVTVLFKTGTVNGLLIPKTAVVMNGGKPVVFLVRDNKAYLTAIDVEKDYLNSVVVSNLSPDDVLVTENAYLLSDQMDVVIQ